MAAQEHVCRFVVLKEGIERVEIVEEVTGRRWDSFGGDKLLLLYARYQAALCGR